jgi:TPR repeat protein
MESMPEILSSASLPPEEILRAIFAQAFAGEAMRLPEGASVAGLRQAVALDDEIIGRIFQQVRASSRRARLAAQLLPAQRAPGARVAAAPSRRRIMPAVLCAGLLSFAIGDSILQKLRELEPPPVPAGQLYALAVHDQAAYLALAAQARRGDAAAQFDVGTLLDRNFLQGETTVPKDDAAALRWYQAAANAGFGPAEMNLGFAYQSGHGVARNDALAAKYYQLAAATGRANAENSLGYLYQQGLGVKQDAAQAVAWYQKAAAQGLAAAENNLAAAYQNGQGVAQNIQAAALWFGRAAAQGEPNAANSLGFLYYTGQGVAPDSGAAFKWFSLAAKAGNAQAQLNLGLLYAKGAGVAQDNIGAAKWFFLAQAHGDAQAAAALHLINPPLTDVELAAAQAEARSWDAQRAAGQ